MTTKRFGKVNAKTLQSAEQVLEELPVVPANPTAGYKKLYCKSDGKLYILDSSGNEKTISGVDQWSTGKAYVGGADSKYVSDFCQY